MWAALDVDQLAVADQQGRTAMQLAREHGHGEIADRIQSHLNALAVNLSDNISRIEVKGLRPEELAEAAAAEAPETQVDEDARRRRFTAAALRNLHHVRSLAWRAMDNREKAEADQKRSTGL